MDRVDTERRRAPRRRVLKGGKISFHHLATSTDCTVRNLSPLGACLMVASQVGIPDDFDLILDGDHAAKHCRARWRSENKIGVEFH
jgi:PilZ domain